MPPAGLPSLLLDAERDDLVTGLTSPTDADYLRWLVDYLQRTTGFAFAFVSELWGEDMDRVQTLAVQSAAGPIGNFEYDLLHTPCANVLEAPNTCCYPRSVAPQFPEDLLLAEMGIEGYIGHRLTGRDGQPVGLIALLDTKPIAEDQLVRAEALLRAFRGRTETVLAHRRTQRELESFESQLDPSDADDLLSELARVAVQAMHVKAAFVACYVDPEHRRLATEVVNVEGQRAERFELDVAGSPCELHDGQTLVITHDVRAAFPRAEFLARLDAQSFVGRALEDTQGQPLGYFAIVHDRPLAARSGEQPVFRLIAERVGFELQRRRILAERRAAERRMLERQRIESLGILAGGIAHDFNNLLVGILGNADLALELAPADASSRACLEGIIESAEQAARLCNQMLAYAGRARLETSRFELGALIRDVSKLLRASIVKTCELVLELDERPIWLEGDRTQITQILINLLTNAADAIGEAPGSIRVRIQLESRAPCEREHLIPSGPLEPGRYACVEVIDTGCGMDEATRARIFDPFFTTKPNGHGLGLAAMLGIVKRHRGGVQVESEPGQGTTFRLWLPAAEPAAVEATEHERGAAGSRSCILVVDDEPQARKVVAAMLSNAGHDVLLAVDGVEALEVFERERSRIRVVLLDVSMPRLGGIETLARLRAIDPKVKVVLASGRTQLDQVEGSEQPDRVVQKPYRMKALLEMIDELS